LIAAGRSCSSPPSPRPPANILFLTSEWGYTILRAGFAVTSGPLMAAASSALAGRMIDRYGQRVRPCPAGLLFALGCVLFATGLGSEPAYLAHFLPATILTGIGVGLSFAGWSPAAVADLPPARFATGSAISACCRQLGAVLGISVLIAIIGATLHCAYALMAGTGGLAALIGLTFRRVSATVPTWTSKSTPSTTPSPEPAPSAARP
jgi:MFS family permease